MTLAAGISPSRPRRSEWWIYALLFGAALGVRMIRLFELDIWFDEAVIVLQLKKSFAEIWNVCKTDNFPPLYVWVMKLWSSIFPGEHSLRFGTALLGSLTPPAVYLLGKTLLDRRLGWFLGILCILSPPLIYQQQMIRMYSLFTLFSCLSLIGFFRAMQSHRWQDWILMAAANLLGFYTFLFMGFLIVAEALVVVWRYKLQVDRYLRPMMVHAPATMLMLIWAIPALQRAQELQTDFIVIPFSVQELAKLWVFFGTGTDYGNNYNLTLILNLPFFIGALLALLQVRRYPRFGVAAALLVLPIIMVAVVSLGRQSIFLKRYFIFLLPIYLSLAVGGWLVVSRSVVRRAGLALLLLVILGSSIFYFVDYDEQHSEYGYIKGFEPRRELNGHAISQAARLLKARLGPGEVIVHFSNSGARSFSFFPMIWYHQRSLPEYIYSCGDVPTYFGGQYLQPGDQIRALHDLQPAPAKIWLVSLDSTEIFFDSTSSLARFTRLKWLDREDFPRELDEAGYARKETVFFGGVTLIQYRREEGAG